MRNIWLVIGFVVYLAALNDRDVLLQAWMFVCVCAFILCLCCPLYR
jgi:energy-converting hydrogenase Eha subunit C